MHVCFRYCAPGQLVASNTLVMGKYLNNFRYFAPGQLLRLFGSRLNKVHLWSSCFAVGGEGRFMVVRPFVPTCHGQARVRSRTSETACIEAVFHSGGDQLHCSSSNML